MFETVHLCILKFYEKTVALNKVQAGHLNSHFQMLHSRGWTPVLTHAYDLFPKGFENHLGLDDTVLAVGLGDVVVEELKSLWSIDGFSSGLALLDALDRFVKSGTDTSFIIEGWKKHQGFFFELLRSVSIFAIAPMHKNAGLKAIIMPKERSFLVTLS